MIPRSRTYRQLLNACNITPANSCCSISNSQSSSSLQKRWHQSCTNQSTNHSLYGFRGSFSRILHKYSAHPLKCPGVKFPASALEMSKLLGIPCFQLGSIIMLQQQKFLSSWCNTEGKSDCKLRIAIVGAGAAGMTAALHLTPLVSAGVIAGPIDIYETFNITGSQDLNTPNAPNSRGQSYSGSGTQGRNIGVGVWSTAWKQFLLNLDADLPFDKAVHNSAIEVKIFHEKRRKSYQNLLKDLEMCGSFVKEVGYRTPKGCWLVHSELNANPYGIKDILNNHLHPEKFLEGYHVDKELVRRKCIDDPSLLFILENDLLWCLRNAVNTEQNMGTIALHPGVTVDGIENVDGDLGSLILRSVKTSESNTLEKQRLFSPQYHLIIAADGIHSTLRSRYAGHHSNHATDMGSPHSKSPQYSKWDHTGGQKLATMVEERNYIVFRGNSPKLDEDENGRRSFQTWGEDKSMRFAAVPFRHARDITINTESDKGNDVHYSNFEKTTDGVVWFATINDRKLYDACFTVGKSLNPEERKQVLIEAFHSWHKPVTRLMLATPAENILYEKAVAHRYNASPVLDVASILDYEKWRDTVKANVLKDSSNLTTDRAGIINGPGPIIVFIGDSMMTVDPVLAQGFTMAMESSAIVARSVERIVIQTSTLNSTHSQKYHVTQLLRKELMNRHIRFEQRLLSLLRSTELVQRLAQLNGGIEGFVATRVVRPLVKYCPDRLKKRLFDYMIRYSLGLSSRDQLE